MIELTRLNGTLFFLNPDMLITIESTPDTVISLKNGEKLVIQESLEHITAQFIAYKQKIMSGNFEVKAYEAPQEIK